MKYVVNFSTGLSSFEAARRTIEQKGAENTIVVFCDVRGDVKRDPHAAPAGTNWDGEDEDNYRFLEDAERLLGVPILRIQHHRGLGVWGAIFEERAIKISGQANTFAPCTKKLKMETMDAFVATLWPEPVVQVLGLGWMEDDRVAKAVDRMRTDIFHDVWFPMTEKPYMDNCTIAAYLLERGVEPPRSYSLGYPHANCGGACVKSGQQQWAALLQNNRERYLYNERQEDLFRSTINPNVAILRTQKRGKTYPLPLKQFRKEILAGTRQPEPFDWGGCGCFIPAQSMRDDLIQIGVPA